MSKSIELMTEAIELNDCLMIKKLQLKEGWTDDEIHKLKQQRLHNMLVEMDHKGELVSWEELVAMVEED